MEKISKLDDGTFLQGGKFRIVRFIGAGGFGCTYEAVFTVLNVRVAIKEFFPHELCNRDTTGHMSVGTLGQEEFVERMRRKFVDEARTLFLFSGMEGVVKVTDVFEENGTSYFVMDYIEGENLQSLISRNGIMPESEALAIIRDAGNALERVHTRNCLHLDIKPANIMIDAEGHPVLIDFGVSKQYSTDEGTNKSTLLGCTPGYAPLEQMNGDVRTFFKATDVYSLAATLYTMLTGQTPPSVYQLLNEAGALRLPAALSEKTRKAIEAAMRIRVDERPQTVSEFLAMLPTSVDTPSQETKVHEKSSQETRLKEDASTQATRLKRQSEEPRVRPSATDSVTVERKADSETTDAKDPQIYVNPKPNLNPWIRRIVFALAVVACLGIIWFALPKGGIDEGFSVDSYFTENIAPLPSDSLETAMILALNDGWRAYSLHDWNNFSAEQKRAIYPVGVQLSADGTQILVALSDADDGNAFMWEAVKQSENCHNFGELTDYRYAGDAMTDLWGPYNTNVVLEYSKNGRRFPAFEYAYTYSRGITEWHLPSAGEMWLVYRNLEEINRVLDALADRGGKRIGNGCYWTSSEYDSCNAWYINFNDGKMKAGIKTNHSSVRPVSYNPYWNPVTAEEAAEAPAVEAEAAAPEA